MSTALDPSLYRNLSLPWIMSPAERYTLFGLLDAAQSEVAIEVGVAGGGSLQAIAAASGKVHAIDCDPHCEKTLSDRFPNVIWHTGGSDVLLPLVLRECSQRGDRLGFILIDGDHSTEGIYRDLTAILTGYVPIRPLFIVCHDSFNPYCRAGMLRAPWAACPYVHSVDIDFVTGCFWHNCPDKQQRSMWRGFSFAILRPEKRTGPLVITQEQETKFAICRLHSRYTTARRLFYAITEPARYWMGPIKRKIRRLIAG